jgi:phenylacetate-coenzyme A ligase PaaK-like adenylate-forming protein
MAEPGPAAGTGKKREAPGRRTADRRITDYEAARRSVDSDDARQQAGAETPHRALRALLEFARAYVPLLRNLPEAPPDAEDPLASYPIVDRQVIRDRFADTLSDPSVTLAGVAAHFADAPDRYFRDRYQVFLSAGRDGDLAYFVHDRAMWRRFCADFLRHFRRCGADLDGRIAFVGTSDRRHTLYRLARMFPDGQATAVGLQNGLDKAVRQLDRFRPDILCGFSSALGMIADAQLAGRLAIQPAAVFANTDMATAEIRSAIRRAWGRAPYELIASTECGVIAYECPSGRMHLNEGAVHLGGRPATAAGLAQAASPHALLTSRINLVQPIINYRVPLALDRVPDHCVCGSADPLVRVSGGRAISPLRLHGPGGAAGPLHPIVLRSALDLVPGLLCAIPRVEDGKLHLAVRGAAELDAVRAAASAALTRAGFPGVGIVVERAA